MLASCNRRYYNVSAGTDKNTRKIIGQLMRGRDSKWTLPVYVSKALSLASTCKAIAVSTKNLDSIWTEVDIAE